MSLENVERKTHHYVEFLFPGILFPEEQVKEIEERCEHELPAGAFAYTFFDVVKTTVGKETYEGKRSNQSGRYYPGGVLMTLEDVKREMPNKNILISNMEVNGWDPIVKTCAGNIQPFFEKDKITSLIDRSASQYTTPPSGDPRSP